MTRRQRIRRIAAAAAAAAALVAGGITGVYQWPGGSSGGGGGLGYLLLDLQVTRDFGALAPRGTGAGQWCGAADGLAAPAHCWELQQSSGDATDYGAVGGWHLSPTGSPRAGVATGLPVEGGGAVDWTSELGIGLDSTSDRYAKAGTTQGASDLLSVSFVAKPRNGGIPNDGSTYYHRSTYGVSVGVRPDTGAAGGFVDGTLALKTIVGATDLRHGWHCVTVVLDGRAANAGRVYVDGSDDTSGTGDLSATGSWVQFAEATSD
jgi:hypothetical protein